MVGLPARGAMQRFKYALQIASIDNSVVVNFDTDVLLHADDTNGNGGFRYAVLHGVGNEIGK